MPTTTWQAAQADIQQPLGFVSFTTTTNITTDTNVISTQLADDYTVDDTFIGWFVIIRGSNNDEVIRRVTDYTASTGTLVVAGANLAAESGSVTCELSRFNPESARRWFNIVRQRAFPDLGIFREHTPFVAGPNQKRFRLPTTLRGKPLRVQAAPWPDAASIAQNEITDPGFEDWASATSLTSWTLAGTGSTVNQEEQTTSPANFNVFAGSNSARIVNNASDTTTLLQTVTPTVATQRVQAVFSIAVYISNAPTGNVVPYLVSAGGTSTKHLGTGWELLTLSATLGEVTTVAVGVSIPAETAYSIYVDEAVLILGPFNRTGPGESTALDLNWETLLRWDWFAPETLLQDGSHAGQSYIELPYTLPSHSVLRIVARDMLSSVSADSDTFEVDGELQEPLYDMVRAELCREAATVGIARNEDRAFWLSQARFYDDRSRGAMVYRHISVPNPHIKVPDWSL